MNEQSEPVARTSEQGAPAAGKTKPASQKRIRRGSHLTRGMSNKPGIRRGTSWRPAFLKALANIPNVSRASLMAGVNPKTVYRHRDSDPVFKSAWDAAFQQGVDAIETSLMRLATKGEEEPIWMKNEVGRPVKVDTIYRVNVTAAIFLLKGHRPNIYRERFLLSSPPGESLSVTSDPAFAEALARAYGQKQEAQPPEAAK